MKEKFNFRDFGSGLSDRIRVRNLMVENNILHIYESYADLIISGNRKIWFYCQPTV